MSEIKTEQFDHPYPLTSHFKKRVIPIIVVLTILIGLIMALSSQWLTESIYLQISERRSASISKALYNNNPKAWEQLQSSVTPKQFLYSPQGQPLLKSIRNEVTELGLSHLKIYGFEAILLYSSDEEKIGNFDSSDGYVRAIKGKSSLVNKLSSNNIKLYELYVQVPNNIHKIVMELYEPIDYLDTLSNQTIIPAALIPMVLLALITWIMMQLANKAQSDITYRNNLVIEYKEKLQKLVSKEAASSVKTSIGKGDVQSRRIKATILFSDIRGFTSFCENENPQTIVSFLNQSLGIVINAINKESGDIDKIIGDAVLGFFQGEKAEERALKSAIAAIIKINHGNFPRKIGIGIFTGDVVIGTVGGASRMDFTLIGDSVNIASRLCSEAKEGEVIIDNDSFSQCHYQHASESKKITLKGRENSLQVIKIKPE